MDGRDFLPSCGLSLQSVSFAVQKLSASCSPVCQSFLFISGLLELLPRSIWSNVVPILSWNNFRFRSYSKVFDPLFIDIVQGERLGSSVSLLKVNIQFS
jgi:hypothetical protein